jgi:hypothetical protein
LLLGLQHGFAHKALLQLTILLLPVVEVAVIQGVAVLAGLEPEPL